jgi:hypothetical protein
MKKRRRTKTKQHSLPSANEKALMEESVRCDTSSRKNCNDHAEVRTTIGNIHRHNPRYVCKLAASRLNNSVCGNPTLRTTAGQALSNCPYHVRPATCRSEIPDVQVRCSKSVARGIFSAAYTRIWPRLHELTRQTKKLAGDLQITGQFSGVMPNAQRLREFE